MTTAVATRATTAAAAQANAGVLPPPTNAAPADPGVDIAAMQTMMQALQSTLATQPAELSAVRVSATASAAAAAASAASSDAAIAQLQAELANAKASVDNGEPPDETLYVPYVANMNPFFARPTNITLAPQVYSLYGDPTFDALKKDALVQGREKEIDAIIKEHVVLTGALSRLFDALHMQAQDMDEIRELIETHSGPDLADRYRAVAGTVEGSYDLLHHRHQYVALQVALERGKTLSVQDQTLMNFVEHELYGTGGAEAAVTVSAPRITKALKQFNTKKSSALLNAAAKQPQDNFRMKTAAQQQNDAAQAKARKEREAAKKKKAADRAAAAP